VRTNFDISVFIALYKKKHSPDRTFNLHKTRYWLLYILRNSTLPSRKIIILAVHYIEQSTMSCVCFFWFSSSKNWGDKTFLSLSKTNNEANTSFLLNVHQQVLDTVLTWEEDWDPVNWFNPATSLCLCAARTWDSNVICHALFLCAVSSVMMRGDCSRCWYWWNYWSSLTCGKSVIFCEYSGFLHQ
jgi:hypothetical protein